MDLKKVMLKGAAYKVIPMRIEATSKDIARNVNRAAKRGLLTHEAGPLTKAAGMEYAEQVFRAGGSYHPTDDTGDLPESPFGPGPGTRKGRGKRWEKSIFDDSLPVKPLGGGMKNSRAFVTFRTMSDPTKMKDKEKAARHRKKWITRGIPPANLIQEVKEELFALIKTGSV